MTVLFLSLGKNSSYLNSPSQTRTVKRRRLSSYRYFQGYFLYHFVKIVKRVLTKHNWHDNYMETNSLPSNNLRGFRIVLRV